MKTKKHLSKILMVILILAAGIGGYIYSALKFIPPHFHANFAMYIEGERVDFSLDKYSEDVAACTVSGTLFPSHRAHLHLNNPDTIHVHHKGVSFGHFFANNNFVFSDIHLVNDEGEVFSEGDENKLSFILNGKKVENPFNTLIKSEDRLLINYGSESEQDLIDRYETVSDNAGEYNAKYDPGSCGGNNENGITVLMNDFLKHFKH